MSASRRIAFIGGGNMAPSLPGDLLAAGRSPQDIAIADPDPDQRERLRKFTATTLTAANAEAAAGATLVVLAVKPQTATSRLRAPCRTLWR